MTTARPRVIGMLGGMSWASSAEYFRLANELVPDLSVRRVGASGRATVSGAPPSVW